MSGCGALNCSKVTSRVSLLFAALLSPPLNFSLWWLCDAGDENKIPHWDLVQMFKLHLAPCDVLNTSACSRVHALQCHRVS
jgi:hypothetical protein